ncbi:unnamed protein product [Bursaphelenchus xylophilus]|uniref:(pine wood nematode) hypothetical protein n=1 Tax=Bursaphelenchus xylophilus TaxID=6326 RepID=A0A1I7S6S5_BURXY|nr:unnamed protein product [Bursaphelenchus xylophilus]CAG9079833.1 unnamed protein product [Bursaphelenchus xylophilus]
MKGLLLPVLVVHLAFGLEIQLEKASRGDFYAYVGNISVGEQQFSVVFDTTVSALWIPNQSCPKDLCEKKSTLDPYTRGLNQCFGYIDVPFQGDQISADCYSGPIKIKQLEPANITSPYVMFGLADRFPSSYKDFPYDGVFGIGPGKEGYILESPLRSLIPRSQNRDYTFTTLKISRPASHKTPDQNKSSVIVGSYFDHCEYVRPFHTLRVHTEGWEFRVDRLSAGHRTINGSWKAGLDINTDFIHLPSRVFQLLVRELGAKNVDGKLSVRCTVNSKVSINIEGIDYRIPIDDLMEVTAGEQCILKIKENKSENGWAFRIGTPFLYSRCAVLDHRYFEYRSIGFPVKTREKSELN